MGSVIYLKENPGKFSLFLLLLILLLMWLMVISLQLCEATRIATWRRSKRTDSRRTGAAVIPFGGSLSSFNCRMVNLLWPTFRSPNRIWAEPWPPPCFESGRLHLIYTDPSPFPLFFIWILKLPIWFDLLPKNWKLLAKWRDSFHFLTGWIKQLQTGEFESNDRTIKSRG